MSNEAVRLAPGRSCMHLPRRLTGLAWLLLSLVAFPSESSRERTLPRPDKSHPGNIFLQGETVVLDLPREGDWRVLDYEGRIVARVPHASKVSLGKLPAGFYTLSSTSFPKRVSLAVLPPLKAPTPLTSPIGLDVAMAWMFPPEKMASVANLCALAGVNWVRDRLHWTEMEPARGRFSGWTRSDSSLAAQRRAGLQVLQMVNNSPPWANPDQSRFPLDLRDVYRHCKAMAERWEGQLAAFEPWNEPDLKRFGGHTGAETASYQKAAYLGLKAGNPDIIACLSPWSLYNTNILQDFLENRAWSYFDTYNFHHYDPLDELPELYKVHRASAAGRPFWVTECGFLFGRSDRPDPGQLSENELLWQAESIAKTFAISIHEGSTATFYFLLPHYAESEFLSGLLEPDLTPRPAYVALATVGRLLADARPAGQVAATGEAVQAFLFTAKPAGNARYVLVLWSKDGSLQIQLPEPPEQLFDHLGRELEAQSELTLTTAPLFAVFTKNRGEKLQTTPPPAALPAFHARPSEIVLQGHWPNDQTDLDNSAWIIPGHREVSIPIHLYNFGRAQASGQLRLEAPPGWRAEFPETIQLEPMSRREATLAIIPPAQSQTGPTTIRVLGNFGEAQSILSLRLEIQ